MLTSAVRARDGFGIIKPMTKMLEEAIEKVRELPEADQDEAAAMLLSVASKNAELVELDDETRTAIREGRKQAQDGEFVSDEPRSSGIME